MSSYLNSIIKNVKVRKNKINLSPIFLPGVLLWNQRSDAHRCHRRSCRRAGGWKLQIIPLPCSLRQDGSHQGEGEDCEFIFVPQGETMHACMQCFTMVFPVHCAVSICLLADTNKKKLTQFCTSTPPAYTINTLSTQWKDFEKEGTKLLKQASHFNLVSHYEPEAARPGGPQLILAHNFFWAHEKVNKREEMTVMQW